MDFSNVNQSEKQAETEVVWKCRFHTHMLTFSRSQFSFGRQKWKTSSYHGCCKERKTEPDCYPNPSLPAAVLGIALGGCLLNLVRAWPGTANRRHLNPSPSWFLATPLTEFRAELAKPPAMSCPYSFLPSLTFSSCFVPSEQVLACCWSFTPLSSHLVTEALSWTWAGPKG